MMNADHIAQLGLQKLAEDAPQRGPTSVDLQALQQALAQVNPQAKPPKKDSLTRYINPLHAPRMEELKKDEAYLKVLAQGLLAGGATGVLTGALIRQSPLKHALLGSAAGGIGAITRRFDLAADPPGLSPVYTVPAGARLGSLAGGLSGGILGRLSGSGILPGLLTGAVSGATAGAVASPWI